MAVLVDTSVLIDIERRAEALQTLTSARKGVVSVVTASELLVGVHRAETDRLQMQRRTFVEHVLTFLRPIPITTQIARVHAETRAMLQRQGNEIDTHDLWIAATALTHGHQLATTNLNDFERVPGLDLVTL